MPAPQRIKVIFRRLLFLNKAYSVGSGQFFFKVTVDGTKVGDPESIFDANNKAWINLPEDTWSHVLNVAGKKQIKITFEGKDEDTVGKKGLGSITYKLKSPYTQQSYRATTQYFALEWVVEFQVKGALFARGRFDLVNSLLPPVAVFACREYEGSLGCTSISGRTLVERLEFCPVIPVPTAAASLPPRPVFPSGAVRAEENSLAAPPIRPDAPINIILNPAVIPILAADDANATTAARIEFTYYRAPIHGFTDDDPRLKWTCVQVSGGAVKFLGPACGRKILVYGTAAGEVKLQCHFQGILMGEYRALVGAVKQIPCRFTIFNGPTLAFTPRATPENVRDHLAIANRFLRQMALELVLDKDTSTSDGAMPTSIPGIFRLRCANGTTTGDCDLNPGFTDATLMNYRPKVMNFAYILSDTDGNLGAADSYPKSGAGLSFPDSGSPSSSWNLPSGVKPDVAAAPVVMTVLPDRTRAGHPDLYSMYITDGPNGNPANLADMQMYAGTIAHEFGHILNLGHRVEGVPAHPPVLQRDMTAADPRPSLMARGIFWDGLIHPPKENVMHWCNPTTLAQDFDIIQAKVARQSPLIPP